MRNREADRVQGRQRRPRRSTVVLPLVVVIAALVALAVVPEMIAGESRMLRDELVHVYNPLRSRVTSLERATGTELSAARAYALTGDPFFVDRFLGIHEYGDQLAEDIDSLATLVGGRVREATSELLTTREYWAEANFGRTRRDFQEGLAEHQEHFEAVIMASQQLQEALEREVDWHNERIVQAERARGRVTILLAIVALFGAGAALWLAYRLARKEAELERAAVDLRTINDTLEERVRERTVTVQELSRELAMTEQRERRQIAQVLHDDLQQLLFAMQLNLQSLEAQADHLPPEPLKRQLAQNHRIAEEAIEATRRLTVDLSPPIQAGDRLVDVLGWLAAHVQERFGLAVQVNASDDRLPSSEASRLLVFQCVRELLFNVVKHAHTGEAVVSLRAENGEIVVEVADEGQGFEPDLAGVAGRSRVGGFGLRAMRERVELFGGRIEIDSAPGKGTRARVLVPKDL